jgi:hypothetical protein
MMRISNIHIIKQSSLKRQEPPSLAPAPQGDCVATVNKGERQSGLKALEECGSFRLWEIVTRIKSNAFIRLVHLNLNG